MISDEDDSTQSKILIISSYLDRLKIVEDINLFLF